jgi:hypothetical protein
VVTLFLRVGHSLQNVLDSFRFLLHICASLVRLIHKNSHCILTRHRCYVPLVNIYLVMPKTFFFFKKYLYLCLHKSVEQFGKGKTSKMTLYILLILITCSQPLRGLRGKFEVLTLSLFCSYLAYLWSDCANERELNYRQTGLNPFFSVSLNLSRKHDYWL